MIFSNYCNGKVVVRLCGGLGNQFFQLAAALFVAEKNNIPLIYLDTRFIANYQSKREFEVGFICKYLPNVHIGIKQKTIFSFASRYRLSRLLNMVIGTIGFFDSFESISTLKKSGAKSFLLDGYFQDSSIAYALKNNQNIFDNLSKEYSNLKKLLPKEYKHYVAVHIRRGDYINSVVGPQVFKNISLDYYFLAIKRFPKNIKFIIFGDDIEVCSNFSNQIGGLTASSLNLTLSEEFMLLAMADHYVIANSTFSWWAAYLGYNESKRVIAPRDWYVNKERSLKNPLLMKYFELLD
jgi:hypothetical protein